MSSIDTYMYHVFLAHIARVASVLWQEVDEETLSLSEHPDIDIRGKVSMVMSGYAQQLNRHLQHSKNRYMYVHIY